MDIWRIYIYLFEAYPLPQIEHLYGFSPAKGRMCMLDVLYTNWF